MKIEIQIKNQQITTEKTRCIVANSVNFITCICTFDEEWEGLSKHVVFTNGEVSKELVITNDTEFALPHEVLIPGKLEISAVGYGDNGEKRLTTKKMSMPLLVYESGDITGSVSEKYTPEVWEQIASVIGNISELSVDADTLVEAINTIVNAGDSGTVLQKDDSGFFLTEEDIEDRIIYYIHDKKNLSESKNIIKLEDGKLSFSKDGGENYPYVLIIDNTDLHKLNEDFTEHKNCIENPHGITAAQIGAVSAERKINGKMLNEDIQITADELGAVSAERKINGKALSEDIMITAEDIGAVAVTRKINGKMLDKDMILTAADVGAEVSGSVSEKIGLHDADALAHGDIRSVLTELQKRINAIADSDDITLDQLSEIVSYIKNNKNIIDSVTTGKVSVSDIINNLTTSAADKPLSAAQGKMLKVLADEHAGNMENPHNVTAQQVGAAPAGYGLGVKSSEMASISDADDATDNGWYRMASSTANGINASAGLFVIANENRYITQFAIQTSTGYTLRRRCINGAWGEWEWEKPPMTLGVEYRTTERWNGKAVYTKLVNYGGMPGYTRYAVEHNCAATNVLRCKGTNISTGASIPCDTLSVFSDKTLITIISTASETKGQIAYIQLWYTKD